MHDLVIPRVRSPFSPVDDNSKAMWSPGFSSSGEYCTPASLPSVSSSDASGGGGGLFATPRQREEPEDDDKPLKIKKAANKKASKTRESILR